MKKDTPETRHPSRIASGEAIGGVLGVRSYSASRLDMGGIMKVQKI